MFIDFLINQNPLNGYVLTQSAIVCRYPWGLRIKSLGYLNSLFLFFDKSVWMGISPRNRICRCLSLTCFSTFLPALWLRTGLACSCILLLWQGTRICTFRESGTCTQTWIRSVKPKLFLDSCLLACSRQFLFPVSSPPSYGFGRTLH